MEKDFNIFFVNSDEEEHRASLLEAFEVRFFYRKGSSVANISLFFFYSLSIVW